MSDGFPLLMNKVTAQKQSRETTPPPGLQVVGTPIGNLEDISLRALRILRQADLIAAEDTRRTRKLLSHYDIHTRMVSYHEYNKQAQTPRLIKKMKDGSVIALVSDAGMPGISDPGYDLISHALEEGIDVTVVPGPSSIIAALVVSGLPTSSFEFAGFLPRKKSERARRLAEFLDSRSTTVLFESPNRLAALLDTIAELAPDRKITIARELGLQIPIITIAKKFEEVLRGSASEMAIRLGERKPRGECVVVIEGAAWAAKPAPRLNGSRSAGDFVEELMREKGLSKKDAMRATAKELNISRREVYRQLLDEGSSQSQDRPPE